MRERMQIIDIDNISYKSQRLLDFQFDNATKSLEEYFECKAVFNKEKESFVFIKGNDVLEVSDIDYLLMNPQGKLSYKKHKQESITENSEIEDFWNDLLEEKEEEKSFSINQKIYSFSKFFMRKYYSSENGWKFYNKIFSLLPGDFKSKIPTTDTDFMWIADRLQNVLNKEEKIKFIVELGL
jgi:hypothetical protein